MDEVQKRRLIERYALIRLILLSTTSGGEFGLISREMISIIKVLGMEPKEILATRTAWFKSQADQAKKNAVWGCRFNPALAYDIGGH